MGFPLHRMRRLRGNEGLRRMVRETSVAVDDMVYPLFVRPGENQEIEITSMPGNYQRSVDLLLKECEGVAELGIPAVILFGIPEVKDEVGSEAYSERGVVQKALSALKKEIPELILIADICLCEYTSHGHCGIIKNGVVDNDLTIEALARSALSCAGAGADIVAPSDMMDGRVRAIRKLLDSEGYEHVPIMAYSAKYASTFYAPFREAAESAPQFGDRKSYQLDPPNAREAIREIELDIEEGADVVMVKPALAYLDIIYRARERFDVPIAAFNVSGEFAMIKAAAKQGWLDEERAMVEVLVSIKRAGADIILTYFAKDMARFLRRQIS